MFFSILVPVYNTSEYLQECVESILNQSFRDYELVLLNDGSTDHSGTMCDEFAAQDDRIRVIHKENEGLMMTRRRGFREAKGDYFICVDSDDKFCDSDALKKIHDMIAETDCDLVIYNYVYGAGGGRPERKSALLDCENGYVFQGEEKMRLYEKLLTSNNMNNMWIKCPARHVVDVDVDYSRWKKEICRAEDLFQSYPMLSNARRIAYMTDPLYYYRWTPGSIGNNPKFRYVDALRCIYQRENAYMEKWMISEQVRKTAISRRLTGFLSVASQCYFSCKRSDNVDKWKTFVSELADDPFFRGILDGCNPKKVLKYYRLLHYLLCNRHFNTAILVIEISSAISGWKHRRKKYV